MPMKKTVVHSAVLLLKLTNAEVLFINDLLVLLFMCQKMRQTQLNKRLFHEPYVNVKFTNLSD